MDRSENLLTNAEALSVRCEDPGVGRVREACGMSFLSAMEPFALCRLFPTAQPLGATGWQLQPLA
jgi:hypothetical protein